MTNSKEEYIHTCLHCGNKSVIQIRDTIDSPEKFTNPDGSFDSFSYYFIVGQCRACNGVLLFLTSELEDSPHDIDKWKLLYPSEKISLLSISSTEVRESYIEAKKVKRHSSLSFAVMIRRSLEFLCMDQKAEGKTLSEKIKNLAERRIIPDVLSEMTDVLRYLGNVGAHATNIKLTREEVEIIDDFFSALVEYVYIAPEKLRKVKARINRKLTS